METAEFKHKLGAKVKSNTIGLIGVITARSEHLYGCNRYSVQPQVNADSKVPEGWWLDEEDITIVSPPEPNKKPTGIKDGGPMEKVSTQRSL